MTNKITTENSMKLLAEELIDDLFASSDEEIVAEATEHFGSVKIALGDFDAEIDLAVNSLAKGRLAQSCAEALAAANRPSPLLDPAEIKQMVEEFFSSPADRGRITMAARHGKASSEDDVFSAFTDLCELRTCKHIARRPQFGEVPKAEWILKDLGVTDPGEINVEAIAWHLGARVKYARLHECEARIVGTDDAAIITVDVNSSPQRQRFSVCHELGHWIFHRRQMLSCVSSEIERPSLESTNLERTADRFASELLMPEYLFIPIAASLGTPSVSVVRKLAKIFNTSQTATAIRLVEINQLPLLLVSHGRNGRRWFTRSKSVTSDWIPSSELGTESSAFSLVFGTNQVAMPPKSTSASTWFRRRDASRFSVIEDSFKTGTNEIVTLLAFKEAKEFRAFVGT